MQILTEVVHQKAQQDYEFIKNEQGQIVKVQKEEKIRGNKVDRIKTDEEGIK